MAYLLTHDTVVQDGDKIGIGTSPSHKLDVNGDVRIRGNDIRDGSGNPAITFDGSANVSIPNDFAVSGKTSLNGVEYTWPASDGASGQVLSTDSNGNLSWATAGGGGSSKATFAMRLAGTFAVTSTSTNRVFTHSSGMGNAMGGTFNLTRTDIGATSNTSFTTTPVQASHYYTIGVVPFDCTLETVAFWVEWRYTYTNAPNYRVWKGTYTDGTAGNVTWTELFAAESCGANSGTTNAIDYGSKSLSSGNSFTAGDIVGFTFETGGTANTSINQFTSTMIFLET